MTDKMNKAETARTLAGMMVSILMALLLFWRVNDTFDRRFLAARLRTVSDVSGTGSISLSQMCAILLEGEQTFGGAVVLLETMSQAVP